MLEDTSKQASFRFHRHLAPPSFRVELANISYDCFDDISFLTRNIAGSPEDIRLKRRAFPFIQAYDKGRGYMSIELWTKDIGGATLFAEAIHDIFKKYHVVQDEPVSNSRFTVGSFSEENLPPHCGGRILTKEEVRAQPGPYCITITEVPLRMDTDQPIVRFCVTNHLFGHGTLPREFVSDTTRVPYQVPGVLGCKTIHDPGDHLQFMEERSFLNKTVMTIETVEELVAHLNKYYSSDSETRS